MKMRHIGSAFGFLLSLTLIGCGVERKRTETNRDKFLHIMSKHKDDLDRLQREWDDLDRTQAAAERERLDGTKRSVRKHEDMVRDTYRSVVSKLSADFDAVGLSRREIQPYWREYWKVEHYDKRALPFVIPGHLHEEASVELTGRPPRTKQEQALIFRVE